MAIDTDALRRAIDRILVKIEAGHERLTELDGKLGDGDLGITLSKAFRELQAVAPSLPDDLGRAFVQAGAAVSKVSSSSFGTLMATGLMAAGKQVKGETSIGLDRVSGLLDAAVDAMKARGGADLGDKTVLDSLHAVARAIEGRQDAAAMLAAAGQGAEAALADFRGKPSKIGRARIFADRSVGLDDAGMVAMQVMVSGAAAG